MCLDWLPEGSDSRFALTSVRGAAYETLTPEPWTERALWLPVQPDYLLDSRAVRRIPLWLVLAGAVLVIVGVLLQAFSIAAFVRGAGSGALDMHRDVADVVHVGELMVAVGAIWAWWGRWLAVGLAVGFVVLSVVQLLLIGDTDTPGGWVNGLHGFFALVLLLAAVLYAQRAARDLGLAARLS
jgi:hypothetical protein